MKATTTNERKQRLNAREVFAARLAYEEESLAKKMQELAASPAYDVQHALAWQTENLMKDSLRIREMRFVMAHTQRLVEKGTDADEAFRISMRLLAEEITEELLGRSLSASSTSPIHNFHRTLEVQVKQEMLRMTRDYTRE